jgi:hypothetical protein
MPGWAVDVIVWGTALGTVALCVGLGIRIARRNKRFPAKIEYLDDGFVYHGALGDKRVRWRDITSAQMRTVEVQSYRYKRVVGRGRGEQLFLVVKAGGDEIDIFPEDFGRAAFGEFKARLERSSSGIPAIGGTVRDFERRVPRDRSEEEEDEDDTGTDDDAEPTGAAPGASERGPDIGAKLEFDLRAKRMLPSFLGGVLLGILVLVTIVNEAGIVLGIVSLAVGALLLVWRPLSLARRWRDRPRSIAFGDEGIRYTARGKSRSLRWGSIRHVTASRLKIVLELPRGDELAILRTSLIAPSGAPPEESFEAVKAHLERRLPEKKLSFD